MVRIKRQRDGDQAAHEVGIAVAPVMEALFAAYARLSLELEPDLAYAAANLVGIVMGGLAQRLERAAELDNIAVAVFPIVEESEIFADRGDVGQGASFGSARPYIGPRADGARAPRDKSIAELFPSAAPGRHPIGGAERIGRWLGAFGGGDVAQFGLRVRVALGGRKNGAGRRAEQRAAYGGIAVASCSGGPNRARDHDALRFVRRANDGTAVKGHMRIDKAQPKSRPNEKHHSMASRRHSQARRDYWHKAAKASSTFRVESARTP
jgi:hypothetical protein